MVIQFLKILMKRKRIHLEEPIGDNEEFKPEMLITLENQYATHKHIGEVNLIKQTESQSTIGKGSLHEHSMKEYLPSSSRVDSMVSQRNYTQTISSPSFLEFEDRTGHLHKSKRNSFPSDIPSDQFKTSVMNKKKSRLLKKVDQLKHLQKTDRHSHAGIFANTSYLNGVIKKERTKNIVKNFIKKLRKDKVDDRLMMELNQLESPPSIFSAKGFELPESVELIFKMFQIFFTFILIFLNSIELVFDGVLQKYIFIIRLCGAVFFALELLVGIVTIKKNEGRRFQALNQIWEQIGLEKIVLDMGGILIIVLDLTIQAQALSLLRMAILVKVPQMLKNLQEVQVKLITKNENEKYWALVKIMLFNFCFAHALAIVLKGMVGGGINWMQVKGIEHAQWYEQYVWSYYWGTNIMLTVGFGDISASNYKQAICLIFLETFSCIVLAYNVNCVGDLILKIKSRDEEKKKQIKVFKKIAQNSSITNDLNWKINNYIQESINLKKNYDLEEEHSFVTNLPKYLKEDFLKQTHKSVFHQLSFFTLLMEKTIYSLAQNIEMRMCHPEETIRNVTDDFHLWIMRAGVVGLACQKRDSDLAGKIMDQITVKQGGVPFILSLNFITKRQLPFEFKSLEYSSFYFMEFTKLISSLRENDSDFQYYAFMRDKHNNLPDEFEPRKCPHCQDRFHYKLQCPAIHHIPNTDKAILQHLMSLKSSKNAKRRFRQRSNYSVQALEIYHFFNLNKNEPSDLSNYSKSLLGEEFQNVRIRTEKECPIDEDISSEMKSKVWNFSTANDNLKDLKEFISGEMEKLTFVQDEADPIWLIKSDTMMDYSKYFQSDNPNNLNSKLQAIKSRRKLRSK